MVTSSTMRWGVPLLAALFTLPSWYQALVRHSGSVQPVLLRFVVALPVAWLLLTLVRVAARVPTPEVEEPAAAQDTLVQGGAGPLQPAPGVSPQQESAA
ncbi:MAG TPA: hypothetical protein VGL26_03275 [Jatrophihabitans sp.]|jgi:hypothetical protein